MVGKVKQELEEENRRHLSISVHYLDTILENYLTVLSGQSKVISVFFDNSSALDELLRYTPNRNQEISSVNLIDGQGRIIASSKSWTKGMDLIERSYFQEVLKTGKPYVSNMFINKIDGKNSFSLSVPIIRDGKTVGVLSSVVNLKFLQAKMHETIINKDPDMLLSIIDGTGTIIYSSDPKHNLTNIYKVPIVQEILAGKRVNKEEFAPIRKEWRVFNCAPLQNAHWGIIISQPTSKAYQLAGYITGQVMLVVILLLIPLLTLTYHLLKLEKLRYSELTEMQREKARTVNELAASVAHEIRNPLTSIRGFMQLLVRNNLTEKAKSYTQVVIEEVDRLEGIVGGFLSLAKVEEERLRTCDLREILKVVHALTESRGLYNKVKVILDASKSVFIQGNYSQLKQAFINLAINALDAMPGGGTLKISLFEKQGKGIVVFQDTGCGMSPEVIKRLGNHYFTTKDNGTGLGIAVSYRILNKHGALIQVESEIERGTTFKIIFPLWK